MNTIPEHYLQQLRDRGLLTGKPFGPDDSYPGAVRIIKPHTTPGNSILGYKSGYSATDDDLYTDAPSTLLLHIDSRWYVESIEHCAEPSRGDFLNEWPTPEQAIADILDLYFGDPSRMQEKADFIAELRQRCAELDAKLNPKHPS